MREEGGGGGEKKTLHIRFVFIFPNRARGNMDYDIRRMCQKAHDEYSLKQEQLAASIFSSIIDGVSHDCSMLSVLSQEHVVLARPHLTMQQIPFKNVHGLRYMYLYITGEKSERGVTRCNKSPGLKASR